MSDPLSSIDPTKKLYSTVPPPAKPSAKAKSPAVDLEYVPPGYAAAPLKLAAPTAPSCSDPSGWDDATLERNYAALRSLFASSPGSVTQADREQLDAIEKVIHERQGTAGKTESAGPAKPKSAVAMLADGGVTLAAGAAKAHMTTDEVRKYVDEYVAYVASRKNDPKYAALHADAVATAPKLIASFVARDEAKKVADLRLAIGERMKNGTIKALQVPLPVGVQSKLVVAPVAIPIAHAIDTAISFVPVAGQLWLAMEVATGKTMGGIGVDIPTAERVMHAVTLAVPLGAKLLKAGSKSADAVIEIARRTGKSTDEVIALIEKAGAPEKDAALASEACARIKAGQPLTAAHHAALDKVEQVLGIEIHRKYTPTVTGTTSLSAGEGGTDKYGNVWYSTAGTKEDVALVKNHESVHSWLSPKALNGLREIRADVRMSGYAKSCALRYVEEAAAEVYAQASVKGLSPKAVITGLAFPVKEGYVKLLPGVLKPPGLEAKWRPGLAADVVLGTIVYAGAVYTAVLVEKKAIDTVQAEINESSANKLEVKP
ncbi:MAG: hypothetical protein HYV09_14935 [Deltaproteobacteria bacterium]|nr:hypothetical protein [Deltaproteobacteria bacterium]